MIYMNDLVYFYTFILLAGKMLGQILVTKQTGAEGKIVSKVGITIYFMLCLHINS